MDIVSLAWAALMVVFTATKKNFRIFLFVSS